MTQAARVLALLRRQSVTVLDVPPGMRLAARIKDLRDAGYQIETTTRELPGGARIAVYRLLPTAPAPYVGVQEGLPL